MLYVGHQLRLLKTVPVRSTGCGPRPCGRAGFMCCIRGTPATPLVDPSRAPRGFRAGHEAESPISRSGWVLVYRASNSRRLPLRGAQEEDTDRVIGLFGGRTRPSSRPAGGVGLGLRFPPRFCFPGAPVVCEPLDKTARCRPQRLVGISSVGHGGDRGCVGRGGARAPSGTPFFRSGTAFCSGATRPAVPSSTWCSATTAKRSCRQRRAPTRDAVWAGRWAGEGERW